MSATSVMADRCARRAAGSGRRARPCAPQGAVGGGAPFLARRLTRAFFAPARSGAMAKPAVGVSRIGLCGLAVMGQVRHLAQRRAACAALRSGRDP